MMDARYRTTIYAKTGKAYIIDIYTPEASTEGIEIIEGIPYDEPLTIEWDEQPKEAPLRPSRLTLKMISPADRSFIHLYAESPTEVMLTVREVMPDKSYRLIWLGWLDPEFYEEPFEQLDNYEVTFTFTDFAPLDRLEFNMDRGRHTLREYLTAALLTISPREYKQLLLEYLSTVDPQQPEVPLLDAVAVMGANFYDEDGEPLSWREVLGGILQPLGLCLMQRDGAFFLFDLNELYNSTTLPTHEIYWTADSQRLSAGPIADKIKISFSTYAETDPISGGSGEEGGGSGLGFGPDVTGNEQKPEDFGGDRFLRIPQGLRTKIWHPGAHPKLDTWLMDAGNWLPMPYQEEGDDNSWEDFRVYLSRQGYGVENLNPKLYYAQIWPTNYKNATKEVVIAARIQSKRQGLEWTKDPATTGEGVLNPIQENPNTEAAEPYPVAFSLEPVFFPKVDPDKAKNFALNLTMQVMVDCRVNPFVQAQEYAPGKETDASKAFNEFARQDQAVRNSQIAIIPARIRWSPTDKLKDATYYLHLRNLGFSPEWMPIADKKPHDTLCFITYSATPNIVATEESGIIGGWHANRELARDNQGMAQVQPLQGVKSDGFYLPYPTEGGFVFIEILSGLKVLNHWEVQAGECYQRDVFAYGESNLGGKTYWAENRIYDYVRWMLYKKPSLSIILDRKSGAKENTDDLCYLCWINKNAKDSIELDTICGTATSESPSAKGVFMNQMGTQLFKLQRGTHINHPELLLAGTLYSQYNKSLTCLRGETCMYARGLPRFTSPHFPNTKFMIKSELQNLADDTSEMTFSEFRPDEYEQLKTQIHD